MKGIIKITSLILFSTIFLSWSSLPKITSAAKVIYHSDDLVITQISKNVFEHTSFLKTDDFGKVACNGMIIRSGHEVIIFDTPTDDKCSDELIKWVSDTLDCKINAVIPTHFHTDCLGGLKAFHEKGIPSYSYFKTIELAKEHHLVAPEHGFTDSLILKVGHQKIIAKFFGEGHTRDNIVGYFPAEDVMFGGCLIKEMGASKGFLGDANVADWPATVEKVKKEYPKVKIVVPGHGAIGNGNLLDYTIRLFESQ